jgi:energy-coupling factor transport system substrate-specific component
MSLLGRSTRPSAVRLRPRATAALVLVSAVGLLAFLWPLFVEPGASLAHRDDAPWLFVLLLPLLLAVVLAEIADGGMDAKAVALLGVLAAVGAALRPLGGGAAGFETVFFLLVLGGRVMGPGFGFVQGSVTLFASALLTAGVGPWLPFQMLAAGWVGFFAGCLPKARGWREIALLSAYGGVAGLAYGMLMNLWTWPFITGLESSISYVAGDDLLSNLARFVAFTLATSLGFDIPRALTNAVLVAVTGRPVLLALRRASRRAAFGAVPEFAAGVRPPTVAPSRPPEGSPSR